MRAPLALALLVAALFAGTGCASHPAEESQPEAAETTCPDGNADPSHKVTAAMSGSVGSTSGTVTTRAATSTPTASQSSMASGPSPGSGSGRSAAIHKSAAAFATGVGGNGATAQKVFAGSDNDVVARRLRKAAEQEKNPTLRAKLWKEYADYRQGTATK